MGKVLWIVLAAGVLALILVVTVGNRIGSILFSPRESSVKQGVATLPIPIADSGGSNQATDGARPDEEVMVTDLEIPWEIVFLPNGEMLVTERPGRLLRISEGKEIVKVFEVAHEAEAGLLGMALHPDFETNQWIYLYMTYRDGGLVNKVVRYVYSDEGLSGEEIILDKIPGAIYHDGGKIAFGPDGLLYVTTGDARVEQSAQDINSLAGKILRIKDDGSVVESNPFGNLVYSWGHRNPQGLTWDDNGNLWATEHGPSGTQTGFDELNLINVGSNYGWPKFKGGDADSNTVGSISTSGASDTWAPGSALYWDGSVFFTGLRGEALYEARLNGAEVVELLEHFKGRYGRLRALTLGPDGYFYLSTSNRDGRGEVGEGDDKIIRINPVVFRR